MLPPSRLHAIADSVYPGKHMSYALYQQGKAIYVVMGEGELTLEELIASTGSIVSGIFDDVLAVSCPTTIPDRSRR